MTKKQKFHEIGRLDNSCPYCFCTLKVRPKRKSKCPECSSQIYVKTRPFDEMQVLLKGEDLEILEKDWALDYEIKSKQPRQLSPEWQARIDEAHAKEYDDDPLVEQAARDSFKEITRLIVSGMAPRDAKDSVIAKYEGDFKNRVDLRIWQLQVRSMGK